jgi:hypothetical protein
MFRLRDNKQVAIKSRLNTVSYNDIIRASKMFQCNSSGNISHWSSIAEKPLTNQGKFQL